MVQVKNHLTKVKHLIAVQKMINKIHSQYISIKNKPDIALVWPLPGTKNFLSMYYYPSNCSQNISDIGKSSTYTVNVPIVAYTV